MAGTALIGRMVAFMRLASFFLISALLHALIFTLPFPSYEEGGGQAIPVTLLIAKDGANQRPVLQGRAMSPKLPAKPLVTAHHSSAPGSGLGSAQSKERGNKKTLSAIADVSEQAKLSVARKLPVRKPPRKRRVMNASVKLDSDVTNRLEVGAGKSEIHKEAKTEEEEESIQAVTLLEESDWALGETGQENGQEAGATDLNLGRLSRTEALEPEDRHGEAVATALNKRFADEATTETGNFIEGQKKGFFTRADYAYRVDPDYPEQARRQGWEGTTMLRVLVDQGGSSKTIQVSQSSGFEALDQAATKAVKDWRFHPARHGAKSVESWVKIPIIFTLKDKKVMNR